MSHKLKTAILYNCNQSETVVKVNLAVTFLQGNKSAGLEGDKDNFNLLMAELKERFDGKYLLTMAAAAGKSKIDDCKYFKLNFTLVYPIRGDLRSNLSRNQYKF